MSRRLPTIQEGDREGSFEDVDQSKWSFKPRRPSYDTTWWMYRSPDPEYYSVRKSVFIGLAVALLAAFAGFLVYKAYKRDSR